MFSLEKTAPCKCTGSTPVPRIKWTSVNMYKGKLPKDISGIIDSYHSGREFAIIAQTSKKLKQEAYVVASQRLNAQSVIVSLSENVTENLQLNEKVASFMKKIEDFNPSVLFKRIPGLEGQLIQLVTNDPNLTELSLMSSNIGDNEAKIIALALRGNTSLKRLLLTNNQIGNEVVIALKNALKGNASLFYLILSENNIRDIVAIDLANAFEDNTSLEVLTISHNQFGDAGVEALNNLDAIQRNLRAANTPTPTCHCTVS